MLFQKGTKDQIVLNFKPGVSMLKMNRKVEYALMALQYIRNKGDQNLTTAREVCDRFHTPFDTTAKVMQQMHHAGILNSIKGVKGGYILSSNLKNISLISLAELVEEKSLSMDCEEVRCELQGSCNISGPIKKLNKYMQTFFDGLSIDDLLNEDSAFFLKARNSDE